MTDDNWRDKITFLCGTCMWFVEKQDGLGRCRRHSPHVGEGWPAVYRTDWCGDHKMDATKQLLKVETSNPPQGALSKPSLVVDLDSWTAAPTLKGTDGFI